MAGNLFEEEFFYRSLIKREKEIERKSERESMREERKLGKEFVYETSN